MQAQRELGCAGSAGPVPPVMCCKQREQRRFSALPLCLPCLTGALLLFYVESLTLDELRILQLSTRRRLLRQYLSAQGLYARVVLLDEA